MRVLQQQAAGGREGEHGAECAVQRLDLDLAVARKGRGALEREADGLRERKVVRVGESNLGIQRGCGILTQQRDDWTRERHDNRDQQVAAVAQLDPRREVVVDVGGRCRGVGRQGNAQRVG